MEWLKVIKFDFDKLIDSQQLVPLMVVIGGATFVFSIRLERHAVENVEEQPDDLFRVAAYHSMRFLPKLQFDDG